MQHAMNSGVQRVKAMMGQKAMQLSMWGDSPDCQVESPKPLRLTALALAVVPKEEARDAKAEAHAAPGGGSRDLILGSHQYGCEQ